MRAETMSGELLVQAEREVAPVESESMIERLARDPSVSVDKLERLIAMQERINKHNAESAFNVAFSALQAEIPTVIERGQSNNGRYALLEDVVESVKPFLAKHGFSLSFRTEWPDPKTPKVVGILTHRAGHSRESEFLTGADKSGNKNDIQGYGSAVSYGRRYTTFDLLNIVSRGQDDDGRRAGKEEKPAPDGFDAWVANLDGLASGGTAAFDAGWAKSPEPLRLHLARTAPKVLASLRTKAAKAGK